ncbi:MAG: peptidase M28, partial [Bacteroidota bacterium]
MIRLLPLGFFCLVATVISAQYAPQAIHTTPEETRALAATITIEDLARHLNILAADDMEGRETGQPGQKKAAAYLKGEMERLGLPTIGEDNGYFQTILFSRQKWAEIDLKLNGESLRHLWEYASAPSQNSHREKVNISELIFLGYGIEDAVYSDYTAAGDLTGKHLLIFAGEPRDKSGNFRISGSKETSTWSESDEKKLLIAKEKG